MVPTSQTDKYNEIVFKLKDMGIFHLVTDDRPWPDRRFIHVNGQSLLNFTSCNYVGLETDPRLKEAAKEAIDKYGVQYYTVRAYASLSPYNELEELLEKMFGFPVVVMPTTMLGHMSILPTLVGRKDAVILDQQVHTSVQMSAAVVKANGTYVEKIRHDRIDHLENRLKKLSTEYEKVWYLADGVYSMYGNIASFEKVSPLLDEYENFCFYVDDSHGMSWTGKHGTGTVMERIPFHERMILITSMGKAYGASGSVGVFKNVEWRDKVRNLGSPMIFTGPLQPPVLGAAIASAKIHLSSEIEPIQARLKGLIEYFKNKAWSLGLPLLGRGESPIFYLGAGRSEVCFQLCQNMVKRGFFTCIATFPSVPQNKSGLRALLTAHHTEADIDNLLYTLKEEYEVVLKQLNIPMESIFKTFDPFIFTEKSEPV